MRKHFVALSLSLSLTSSALAQAPASPELAVPGYQPTVLGSKAEVQKLFDDMPWTFKDPVRLFGKQLGGSQCYMRAQIWTYDWERNQNVRAMKAFVFYTHAYKEAYKKLNKSKFDWWYHVTPYVLAKNAETGQVDEWTLDATFSDEIEDMTTWAKRFVDTGKKCAEYVPYQNFKCEVEGVGADPNNPCEKAVFGTEHCYIVRVPATIYNTDEIEAYHAGKPTSWQWNMKDIREALEKAPIPSSKKFWQSRLGIYIN